MNAGRYIVENLNRPLIYTLLIICVGAITYATINFGYIAGLGIAFAPVFVLYLMYIVDKPIWGFCHDVRNKLLHIRSIQIC